MAEISGLVEETAGRPPIVVGPGCKPEIGTENIKLPRLNVTLGNGPSISGPTQMHILRYIDDTVVSILPAYIAHPDDIAAMRAYYQST